MLPEGSLEGIQVPGFKRPTMLLQSQQVPAHEDQVFPAGETFAEMVLKVSPCNDGSTGVERTCHSVATCVFLDRARLGPEPRGLLISGPFVYWHMHLVSIQLQPGIISSFIA